MPSDLGEFSPYWSAKAPSQARSILLLKPPHRRRGCLISEQIVPAPRSGRRDTIDESGDLSEAELGISLGFDHGDLGVAIVPALQDVDRDVAMVAVHAQIELRRTEGQAANDHVIQE